MEIDFAKSGGLVPAIVQDAGSGAVLMLGYMNEEALKRTQESGKVTFFSRSKQRLWTKGETSGNFLEVRGIFADCDRDALLIEAVPLGPACHSGTRSCFGDEGRTQLEFLAELEKIIRERKAQHTDGSYTCKLFARGLPKMAQKVGEEATEVVVAALAQDLQAVKEEAADLVYHMLVLLRAKGIDLAEIVQTLEARHRG